jgi:ABC-2 type transport system permease protein
MASPSPIADLTYRGYDGPLAPPRDRWWVIAKMGTRLAFKKRWFWYFTLLSAWYSMLMIVIIFFMERVTEVSGNAEQLTRFMQGIYWPDQFLIGFSFGQMLWFAVALLIGAGSIANDNRTNALLVYLSKPCTKVDYLIGKWAGVFFPLCISIGLPLIFFYLYGALSFRGYGFLSEDPWLIVKLLILIPLAAAFYASLAVGISSMFNQGRMAGAAFAGLYFLTSFVTVLVQGLYQMSSGRFREEGLASSVPLLEKLFYASVDGLEIGMAKAVLGTDGSLPFGIANRTPIVPAPSLVGILLVVAAVAAGALAIAWRRIRAVEVVG